MPHYAQSSQNGVNGDFGGNGQGQGASSSSSASSFEKKSKVKVQFADDAKSSSAEGLPAKPAQSSSSASTQSPVKGRSKSPSRQSSSSSIRDYVTNNESKCHGKAPSLPPISPFLSFFLLPASGCDESSKHATHLSNLANRAASDCFFASVGK